MGHRELQQRIGWLAGTHPPQRDPGWCEFAPIDPPIGLDKGGPTIGFSLGHIGSIAGLIAGSIAGSIAGLMIRYLAGH
jgi:hypothetical protein